MLAPVLPQTRHGRGHNTRYGENNLVGLQSVSHQRTSHICVVCEGGGLLEDEGAVVLDGPSLGPIGVFVIRQLSRVILRRRRTTNT